MRQSIQARYQDVLEGGINALGTGVPAYRGTLQGLNTNPNAGTGDYTDKLVYTDVERVKKFLAANNQVCES